MKRAYDFTSYGSSTAEPKSQELNNETQRLILKSTRPNLQNALLEICKQIPEAAELLPSVLSATSRAPRAIKHKPMSYSIPKGLLCRAARKYAPSLPVPASEEVGEEDEEEEVEDEDEDEEADEQRKNQKQKTSRLSTPAASRTIQHKQVRSSIAPHPFLGFAARKTGY